MTFKAYGASVFENKGYLQCSSPRYDLKLSIVQSMQEIYSRKVIRVNHTVAVCTILSQPFQSTFPREC